MLASSGNRTRSAPPDAASPHDRAMRSRLAVASSASTAIWPSATRTSSFSGGTPGSIGVRGVPDGGQDQGVAPAAAEVPGQVLADLPVGGRWVIAQQRLRGYQEPRRAEPALHRAVPHERVLHGVEGAVAGQSLDGPDAPALGPDREEQAGADQLTVYQDRARPARALPAP